ncbi:hypothetical protein [Lysobacter hankyongensis]|uniref:Uncharacterized protein n=1 Tax=Lysobacter hankyongensis TaxID=1176535 RepID=A0ABP9B4V3_9GAMM
MSIVPRIDTPCPLAADEQRTIDGHCGRCDREVHRLDTLDGDARRALFAAATGPLCVSYRAPASRAPRRVGRIGAAIAATLITATAYAADPSSPGTDAQAERAAPTTGSRIQRAEPRDLDEVLVIGAVNDPQDARLPEDTGVPALPVRGDTAPRTGSRIQRGEPRDLDEVLVIGAVNDPQDARLPADTSVPVLPVQEAALQDDDVLIMGGVSDPTAVEWVDVETAAPELPMVTDATTGDGR